MTIRSIAAVAAISVAVSAGVMARSEGAPQLDDRTQRQVIDLVRPLGWTGALAVICHQRDARWFRDLRDEVPIWAIGRVLDENSSDNLAAAVSTDADNYFIGGAASAKDAADGGGAKKLCPVPRSNRDLQRADQLVTTHRKPTDWSGAGGIR